MKLAEFWDRLVSLLYPQRCALCGQVVEYDRMWCGACGYDKADLTDFAVSGMEGFTAAASYVDNVRKAVWQVKSRGDKRCLRFFADRMLEAMAEAWDDAEFDLVTPVPTSSHRLQKRGFNQAELLAAHLAEELNLPMIPEALSRSDSSLTQRDLTADERWKNARQSYGIYQPELVRGKRALLVDDVCTTGATFSACARLLLEAGCTAVYGVAAAKTPSETQ